MSPRAREAIGAPSPGAVRHLGVGGDSPPWRWVVEATVGRVASQGAQRGDLADPDPARDVMRTSIIPSVQTVQMATTAPTSRREP